MIRQFPFLFDKLRSLPRSGFRNPSMMLRYITVVMASLLTINFMAQFATTSIPCRWLSFLVPLTLDDGLHPRYLRLLASSLQKAEYGSLSPTLGLTIGRYVKVDPGYTADYQWLDSDTRIPFQKKYDRWANTNNAISRLPAGSDFDAIIVARGMSNEYSSVEDPKSDKPLLLRNSTLIG